MRGMQRAGWAGMLQEAPGISAWNERDRWIILTPGINPCAGKQSETPIPRMHLQMQNEF